MLSKRAKDTERYKKNKIIHNTIYRKFIFIYSLLKDFCD